MTQQSSGVLVGGWNPDHLFKEKADKVEKKNQERARQEALDAKKRLEEIARQGTQGNSVPHSGSTPETDAEKMGVTADFNIIETPDFFAMTGVRYGGKILRLDLYKHPFKDISPSEFSMTSEEWAATVIRSPDTPTAPTPIYFSAFKAIEGNKDNADQRIRETVQAAREILGELICRGTLLYTTSLVEYHTGSFSGRIIHPAGPHGSERIFGTSVVGDSGEVKNIPGIKNYCLELTDSAPEDLDKFWDWLTKTKPGLVYRPFAQIHRLQNPPQTNTIVRSYVSIETSGTLDGIRFTIQAAGNPDRQLKVLGLRVKNFGYETGAPGWSLEPRAASGGGAP